MAIVVIFRLAILGLAQAILFQARQKHATQMTDVKNLIVLILQLAMALLVSEAQKLELDVTPQHLSVMPPAYVGNQYHP